MLRSAFVLMLALTPLGLCQAWEGRYEVAGHSPLGAYSGHAQVSALADGACQVDLTIHGQGADRRLEAAGRLIRGQLRLRVTTVLAGAAGEAALRGRAHQVQSGLEVRWYDPQGQLVRRERWRPVEVELEVAMVALEGGGSFPGVAPEEAAQAQAQALAQLDRVYGSLGIRFRALQEQPLALPGAAFDEDGDGRLSRREIEALRDALERRGLKRPGRVVLALTRAAFVGHGCRGWTLGDAPATPGTLEDLNDNFSLIGADYVGRDHHTVAHEVGHQLGLDDLGPDNRCVLREPARSDHLMLSGGAGFYLDPAVQECLLRRVRFPDHGLQGRRRAWLPEAVTAGTPVHDAGLLAPPQGVRRP